jgi:hypothetical protein
MMVGLRSVRVVFGTMVLMAPVVVVAETQVPKVSLDRADFKIDGRPAFLIAPAKKFDGSTPWVLYAPTLGRGLPGGSEHWMFRQWLAAGIAIAGVDVGESYGSPKGRATYNALHKHLTEKHGFDKQACLLARSRGGLMLYCWAVENPEKVKCVAGIYPVCNIASYPGIGRASGAYGLTAKQLEADLTKHNPPDRMAALAKAKVPIFHIQGDKDGTVPLEANSQLLAERYKKAGGNMKILVAKGQGHNMWRGFFECQELVDFVTKHAIDKTRHPTFWLSEESGQVSFLQSSECPAARPPGAGAPSRLRNTSSNGHLNFDSRWRITMRH